MNQLPDWLVPAPTMQDAAHPLVNQAPPVEHLPPTTRLLVSGVDATTANKIRRELNELYFGNMFEHVLDRVALGQPVARILREDQRALSSRQFMSWVFKDEKRKAAYYEAQALHAESLADEMIDIADGVNSLEDVNRSSLRINTRRYLAGVFNRARFGEKKDVILENRVSIADALAQADNRLASFAATDGPTLPAEVVDNVIDSDESKPSFKLPTMSDLPGTDEDDWLRQSTRDVGSEDDDV